MEFVTSQDTSNSGVCQSFFIFLICILLPSGPLSLLAIALMVLANAVTLVKEKGGNSAAREDAEIFRAFSVHALTFELHTFPCSFIWSSVARISA